MLDKVTYENHLGEVINFGAEGIYINESDLRDYSWSYDTDYDRISHFRRGVAARKIQAAIVQESEVAALLLKNRLYEILEKDIVSEIPGRLIIGDYYFKCYIVASTKTNYLQSKNQLRLDLQVVSDMPEWVREITYSYYGDTLRSNVVGVAIVGYAKVTETELSGYKMYNYDYPVDYIKDDRQLTRINNPHFKPCDFVMVLNGPMTDPVITIDGHAYALNYTIQEHQQVIINSRERTIILSAEGVTDQNIFNHRDKTSNIFQQIPVGQSAISWNGDYEFAVTLLIDRGEPEWT